MITFYPTVVEAVDELHELAFKVTTFDECVADVEIKKTLHTIESWRELSLAVEGALLLLNLESESKP